MTSTATAPAPHRLGDLLRGWRGRRRLSQLDLASQAGVSPRHLSFVETGRSRPSREMVLHLAEQLDVPLRDRNALLMAAGYAPVYSESALEEPDLITVRQALTAMLRNHEPMPALVVDRKWDLVDANAGMLLFVALLPPALTEPPINVMRASLHPDGIAGRIVNFGEYASHLVDRLRHQLEASGDPDLGALLDEVVAYPNVAAAVGTHGAPAGVVLPMRIAMDDGSVLSFFSTMTVFGAPLDVTLSELAIEAFYPADDATEAAVRAMAASS